MARIAVNGYDGPDRRAAGSDNVIMIWARAIAVVGVPGAIAIILVWLLGNEIPKITKQTELNNQAILSNRALIEELQRDSREQLRLMRWICAGVQKNDADRRNCFDQ